MYVYICATCAALFTNPAPWRPLHYMNYMYIICIYLRDLRRPLYEPARVCAAAAGGRRLPSMRVAGPGVV